MNSQFEKIDVVGNEVSENLFGGNILAYRQEMEGDGQYEHAIDHLGITDLRYPGGSTTEYYFDITNPDSGTATHSETGEVIDFIPLSDFMNFAGANDHAVTIVLPTRHSFLETEDENGHRIVDVDEVTVRQFVRDVVEGKYGDAEIRAFEIGNEYWLSGDMDAVEYGRVASEMVDILDDELMLIAKHNPDAEHIDILVQMGLNHGTSRMTGEYDERPVEEVIDHFNDTYGLDMEDEALYSSGRINFNHVANELIIGELEKSGSMEEVDGVIAHVYSLGEKNTWSKVFELKEIEDTWMQDYPELDTYVTEWNMKGVTQLLDRYEDYGLYQATEMLNIVEEFVKFDVDVAHVWPLVQNTNNALNVGGAYEEPNAPGEFFSIMSKILPGKKLLDFATGDNLKTEATFEEFNVHGFADEGEVSLFVTTSHKEGIAHTDLDVTDLVASYGSVELSILGVEDGFPQGDNDSHAAVEVLDPETSIIDGFIEVPLDPGEILIVRLYDYEPTPALASALGLELGQAGPTVDPDEPDDEWGFPVVEIREDDPSDILKDEETFDDDDGGDGMVWLLALLPLLALFGMA